MYLRSVVVENVGPIRQIRTELPFDGDRPLPLVLVGPNGSGKSTLLSLIVNALVGFKQQAYDRAEVEQNKVYRVRSGEFIRHGARWSHAKLNFEGGLSLEEWVLDRPRKAFEADSDPLPSDDGWRRMPEEMPYSFELSPPSPPAIAGRVLSKPIQKLFGENVVAFFPSDRFELPDWLNEPSLAEELRFPEAVRYEGQTARRIFARALLRPTLEWVKAVVLDARLSDFQNVTLPVPVGLGLRHLSCLIETDGPNTRIIRFVSKLLGRVLGADGDDVQFQFAHRNAATVGAVFRRGGRPERLSNLLGLSAGQAALFCIFCTIIRDFDLAGAPFGDISDVRGIVVLDEADLHLHVDLQYRVLPDLLKLFPKVQFILTAHSPLLVMGMERAFGAGGFRVIDVASGEGIAAEQFGEFEDALAAFTRTRSFDQRVMEQVQMAAKPVILVEGKFDEQHLRAAWEGLNPGRPMPWDVIPSGGFSAKVGRGGAEMLRTMLRACCLHSDRPVLGLFDHDEEGVKQFGGLKDDDMVSDSDSTHRRLAHRPIHALLLPVPPGRAAFVGSKPRACFLALEHYYPDALLARFGLADEPVASDSAVFGIVSDSKKKGRLAEALPGLSPAEFGNFRLLFDRLASLLGGASTVEVLPPADLQPPEPGAGVQTATFAFDTTPLAPDFAASLESAQPGLAANEPSRTLDRSGEDGCDAAGS